MNPEQSTTVQDLMRMNSMNVLRVCSTDRKKAGESVDTTPEQDEEALDYWIRYETDTGLVYVKSRQFKTETADWVRVYLMNSSQYRGYTNKHFYAGTKFKSKLCACHVFDVKMVCTPRKETQVDGIPRDKWLRHRNYLQKTYGNDLHTVTIKLKEWEENYLRPKKITKGRHPKPESETERKKAAKKLKARVDELEKQHAMLREWAEEVDKNVGVIDFDGVSSLFKALSMRILASQPADQQDKKEKEPLDAITAYIRENDAGIRKTITRLGKEPGDGEKMIPVLITLPEYDPRAHGLETIGRYIETVRSDGGGRKKTLYLHTVPLRAYLERKHPHVRVKLKHDVRYTHSQNFKLHSLPDASGLYCAVFDMRRGKKPIKQENNDE